MVLWHQGFPLPDNPSDSKQSRNRPGVQVGLERLKYSSENPTEHRFNRDPWHQPDHQFVCGQDRIICKEKSDGDLRNFLLTLVTP